MFTGTYYNSIDSKYRMIIPNKLRESLGGRCMISKGYDECLYIYSMDGWQELYERVRNNKQSDAKVRMFLRSVFSNADECQLDAQGRIIIPPHLREYAGIQKNLVTLGVMDKIEVWSAEAYEKLDKFDFEEFFENHEL